MPHHASANATKLLRVYFRYMRERRLPGVWLVLIGQHVCYHSHEVGKIAVLLPSSIALAACNLGTPELESRFGLPIKRK